ncbi:MAG TPA: hypothetical protein VK599_14075 [Streptosporangiaceae bacterium]|nr:hypothetical protein [Streptosporangiaceae bacterium]
MNLGGEPERDDSGLPPVDIVVPEDARELDRDVQAYRRELGALRRHQRRMRWHGPLTRDGVILPLLASCLVLALIAGTLLTFFTARPGGEPAAGRAPAARGALPPTPARPSPSGPPDSPPVTASAQRFPAGLDLKVNGVIVPARLLTDRVFALVPAGCRCGKVLMDLADQAAQADVPLYLVGGAGLASVTEISDDLAGPQQAGSFAVAEDADGTLARTYLTPGQASAGSAPSALLVATDGRVSKGALLTGGFRLGRALAGLGGPVS